MFTDYDFCDTAEVVLSAQDKMERMLEISIVENEKKALDYYLIENEWIAVTLCLLN